MPAPPVEPRRKRTEKPYRHRALHAFSTDDRDKDPKARFLFWGGCEIKLCAANGPDMHGSNDARGDTNPRSGWSGLSPGWGRGNSRVFYYMAVVRSLRKSASSVERRRDSGAWPICWERAAATVIANLHVFNLGDGVINE